VLSDVSGSGPVGRTGAQPNVVVFLTDQQRWDTTGVHGNPLGLTPNFDRFANTGTLCVNAFTCQPVCAPARSAIQTGQYPTATGVYRNGIALKRDAVTLAKLLSADGYDTAYIGKWHLAATGTEAVPEDLRGGYDYWLAGDAVELFSDAYDARLYDGDGNLRALPGYRADAYVDAAIDYLAADHERPFLLFVSLLEPHHQNHRDDYPAPHGYREQYEGRWTPPDLAALGGNAAQHLGGYWGMVKRVDEAFGRLLDALESLGQRENTVVAYATDHGCHFRTRNSEYKRSAHDASIRIPMALNGPGFTAGGRIPQLVSLIDLPPSLLDAAGVSVPDEMHGRSVLPLVRKQTVDWPDNVFIQISESHVGRAIRTERWKYAVCAPHGDGWTDAGSDRYVESELYDLFADPSELTNLVGQPAFADIAADLKSRLVERMLQVGEQRPHIEPASVASPEQGRAPALRR
jgi:choline-sulfatase